MKRVKILLIALVLILSGVFFSYVNAQAPDLSTGNTRTLKFKER